MPDQKKLTGETSAVADPQHEGKKSPFFVRLWILLFVALVVTLEGAVAYVILPDVSKTKVMAEKTVASDSQAEAEEDSEDAGPQSADETADQIEVDLGEFTVTAFQPLSNTTMRIDFHLFGTIGKNDDKEFLALMDENLHRFREQVIMIVRGADSADLTDPTLGLIKRKVLERTSKTLGKPLLRDVIVSDFSFLEQ